MKFRPLAGLAFALSIATPCLAVDVDRPDVAEFIDTMVRKYDYDRGTLRDILGEAEIKESIIELISKPAEKTRTWAEYRPIFLTRERVSAGAEFWREHRSSLEKISNNTGVPIEIIVGIIGVETYFGRITGSHRVIDALTTLAFEYPPRSRFFRGELEHFLLLVREEGMPATEAIGSYAGAMGRPQFMPSSYRAYAVDSTGDGKRDIWNNWTDVAGSIANYFVKHGWKPGEEIVSSATLGQDWQGPLPDNSLQADDTIGSLSSKGVMFSTDLPGESACHLVALDGDAGEEYWVGFHNFFVITRYNRSVMYALVVQQLGQEIALEVGAHDSRHSPVHGPRAGGGHTQQLRFQRGSRQCPSGWQLLRIEAATGCHTETRTQKPLRQRTHLRSTRQDLSCFAHQLRLQRTRGRVMVRQQVSRQPHLHA